MSKGTNLVLLIMVAVLILYLAWRTDFVDKLINPGFATIPAPPDAPASTAH